MEGGLACALALPTVCESLWASISPIHKENWGWGEGHRRLNQTCPLRFRTPIPCPDGTLRSRQDHMQLGEGSHGDFLPPCPL